MGKRTHITPQMLAAGVRVYSNPKRYETYEQVVTRLFRAMIKVQKSGCPRGYEKGDQDG